MDLLRIMHGGVLLALLTSALLVCAEPYPIVPFAPDLVLIKGVGVVAVNPLVELCDLQMNQQGHVLTVTRQGKSFTCTLGKTGAEQNGKPITLKMAPFQRADAIYLPARPLIEALGGTLTFTQPVVPLYDDEKSVMLSLPGLKEPIRLLMVRPTDNTTALSDEDDEVYLINIDGSGQRRLSYDEEMNELPIVAPEGTWMLYPDHWRLMVRPLDAPHARPLVSTVYSPHMVPGIIAPDSKRILFVDEDDDEKTRVGIINVDGSGKQILAYGDAPCFTPDGQAILYASDAVDHLLFATNQWHLMDLNGKHIRDFGKELLSPSFSADGARVMFTRFYRPPKESDIIYSFMPVVYQLKGENAGRSFEAPEQQRTLFEGGTLSPDGQTLLVCRTCFSSNPNTKLPDNTMEKGVVSMQVDRSGERLLWREQAVPLTYSPDGKYIFLIHDNALYRMQSDGSAVQRLTSGISIAQSLTGLAFTPDGQQILFLATPVKGADPFANFPGGWEGLMRWYCAVT